MSNSDYRTRQIQHEADYQRQYDEWVNSLSPEEREELDELGVARPSVERAAYGVGRKEDLGGEAVFKPLVEIMNDNKADAALLESIRMIVATLIGGSNIQVELHGLAFAAGLNICCKWGSQANAAKSLGVSRQHLGKSTKRWQEMLCLPSNPYTSSKAKSAKLKKVQTENHWRKRKFTK